MRCYNCGAEMSCIGANSQTLPDGEYKTVRHYLCRKCGNKQSENMDGVGD